MGTKEKGRLLAPLILPLVVLLRGRCGRRCRRRRGLGGALAAGGRRRLARAHQPTTADGVLGKIGVVAFFGQVRLQARKRGATAVRL